MFFASLLSWIVGSLVSLRLYIAYANNRIDQLPENHPHRPAKMNDAWENDEIKDILQFLGIRSVGLMS